MEFKLPMLYCNNALFASANIPGVIGKCPSGTFDFDLTGYGYIKPEDVYIKLCSEDTENGKTLTLDCFKSISVKYNSTMIAVKTFNFGSVKSVSARIDNSNCKNVYRLSDIFSGLRFNVFNSYKTKLVIRFTRNNNIYEDLKTIKVGYLINWDEPSKIIKYKDELIKFYNKTVKYLINSSYDRPVLYFIEKNNIIPVAERLHNLYYNDMKLEMPYSQYDNVYGIAGSYAINTDFDFDYLYIEHTGELSYLC